VAAAIPVPVAATRAASSAITITEDMSDTPAEVESAAVRMIARCVVTVCALALVPAAAAHAASSEYGIQSTAVSLSTAAAGAHPDLSLRVDLKTDPVTGAAVAGTRDVAVDLPPGLIAAPAKFPVCPVEPFFRTLETGEEPPCPVESQVGVVNLGIFTGDTTGVLPEPLYNLPPADGAPARFGFFISLVPQILEFSVRPEDGYRLHAEIHGALDFYVMNSAEAVVWGVPSDPAHDTLRMTPAEAGECGYACHAPGNSRPSPFPAVPLTTNPTWCGGATVQFATTTYARPGDIFRDTAEIPAIGGCEGLAFGPTAEVAATTTTVDSPTGLRLHLHMPREGFETAGALAPSALRGLVVSLPSGYSLNPAAAAHIGVCSERQVGLLDDQPPVFDNAPSDCPQDSSIGTASISTPILGEDLRGAIYLATPGDNPSNSLVGLYLVAERGGVIVKLAGRLVLDPSSDRLEARFDDLPPLPISDVSVEFERSGVGLLTTPLTCGTHQGNVSFHGWSGRTTTQAIPLPTESSPSGVPCGPPPFHPGLIAGTTTAVAGSTSPLEVRIERAPGEQNLSRFDVTLPPGLLPDIAKVQICTAPSTGACPAASQVGSVSILAGAGPAPLRIPEPGSASAPIYLAGPEGGAPFSLVTDVPVRAGPFDLGHVAVRARLYLDPRTAQATVRSEPLPQVVDGIPIAYRQLRLTLDRAGFIRNPTSCRGMRISSTMTGAEGGKAAPSSRFRVGSCRDLRFHPRLAIALGGSTGRGGHPSLSMHLRGAAGGENLSRLSVLLPATELLDTRHVSGVCSAAPFGGDRGCGFKAVYGHATVSSSLLAQPLRGPVYLSSSARRLPDLAASVTGPISLTLVGRVDSVGGRLRVIFANLPDAPLTELQLGLVGARRGLLVNDANLCQANPRATVVFTGQNGRRRVLTSPVRTSCRQPRTTSSP
jgi:hypothetical protein